MAQAGALPPDRPTGRLVGESAATRALNEQVRHLATFDTLGNPEVPTLLLHGETGTGKGLVARVSHASGPRVDGPFIEVNCAAIPETLLEAELFGFEAGAFTDAKRAKPGLLESASGGTLLLDEIDSLPLPLQGKLLNAIDEKRVRRVGAVLDRAVDVKVIATTQADLNACVARGSFRADLYYRLAVVVLEVPPLRERGEDVVVLAQYFLRRYAEAHGLVAKRLSGAAASWLRDYNWPGNVRELSHLMERVTLLSPEAILTSDTFERLCLPRPQPRISPVPERSGEWEPPDECMQIAQALDWAEGNVMRAARFLGLSRSALRHRMRRYRIERPSKAQAPRGDLTTELTPHSALSLPRPPRGDGSSAHRDERRPLSTSEETPAPAPDWEQKPVAVLAIELTWPETMELEAPRYEPWTATAAWEQAITDKVRGFGGVLLQRSPSLLTAAFGIPRTIDQLPHRAVQVALAIRHQLAEAKAAKGTEPCPGVRLAVHLGQMLVEIQASDPTPRGLPVGETLALPVRLLGLAAPGDLLVSPQVRRLVEGWFELEAREVAFGGAQPHRISAYNVVGLDPKRFSLAGMEVRVHNRFVGREQELGILHGLWARVERGGGQVVGIVGESGVGKSRLLYEFCQQVEARVERAPRGPGVRFLEGRCLAYGSTVPYRPVPDLLKAYFEIEDQGKRAQVRAKVTGKLHTLDETLSSALPAFLGLLEVPIEDPQWQALDPSQRRRRTLDAFKRLMLRESQVQPLCLVLEDMHWIDAETQALFDSLVESLPTARILLLVTYRPEYLHSWGNRTYYTQLRFGPLPPERAEDLLRMLLGEHRSLQPLTQILIDRTEGNPFFLEESVQTLVETGDLVGERGTYRLHKAFPTMQVPTTIQAILAARIDRRPPEDRRLLQTAAVIGIEVPLPLLEAIADFSDETLRGGLAHLQAAEFLYETSLFAAIAYTFKHALTQEVAYGSLRQERRRALHARIVEAIERLYPDHPAEQIERLAHHALRGEVWDKAVAYCREAGERALARSAHREAVGCFEQALSALSHLPEQRDTREQAIDLRLALRPALRPLGDFGRRVALLREAESVAAALNDPGRLGRVSLLLSDDFRTMGSYDQAIAAAQRALALSTTGADVGLHALAHQNLGFAYRCQGNYRRAIDCLEQAIGSLKGAQHRERFIRVNLPAVLSRAWLAACHAELGTFAQGYALADEGLRIADAAAHPGSRMFAAWGFGLLFLHQGDLPRALPLLERAVATCQDADLPVYFPLMAAALGAAYCLSGRVLDAVVLLTQAMEQSTAREVVYYQARCRLSMGEAQLLADDLEEAHALAEGALALVREHQERGNQAYALRLLGNIAARREPPEAELAERYYQQALALAEELGMRPLQAHCHLGLGALYQQTRRLEQAHTELSAAIDLYRSMEMTFWLPQVEGR